MLAGETEERTEEIVMREPFLRRCMPGRNWRMVWNAERVLDAKVLFGCQPISGARKDMAEGG